MVQGLMRLAPSGATPSDAKLILCTALASMASARVKLTSSAVAYLISASVSVPSQRVDPLARQRHPL